jgi:hypothetical protein
MKSLLGLSMPPVPGETQTRAHWCHTGGTLALPKWLARLALGGCVCFNPTDETAEITLFSEGFGALWGGGEFDPPPVGV